MLGHGDVYFLIEKKICIKVSPETAKGFGQEVMQRTGSKEARGKGQRAFPTNFSDIIDDDIKREISSEKTKLKSENSCPELILLKASRPAYRLGLI